MRRGLEGFKVCSVGAGATGLTAGYELSRRGAAVTIFEADSEVGGLMGTFKVGSTRLEKFYHHLFTNDAELIELIREMGLESKLVWRTPASGIYLNGGLYDFGTAKDLMKFGQLSVMDRLRFARFVHRMRGIDDWRALEGKTAREWVIEGAGRGVYEKVWGPLLKAKFDADADKVSAAWLWKRITLRSTSRESALAGERLGYLDGSFGVLYDAMVERIKGCGGKVRCSDGVRQVVRTGDGSFDVVTGAGRERFDKVIVTIAPSLMLKMVQYLPDAYAEKLRQIKYKANICVVLELADSLSRYYWISVARDDMPFVAVVEHTNMMPVDAYGGHVVYLSRYADQKSDVYMMSNAELQELFIGKLAEMFPGWDRSGVRAVHVNSARYAQPVVCTGYSAMIPDFETGVDGLYLACMAQIYPEDRGQNYSIRIGRQVADVVSGR